MATEESFDLFERLAKTGTGRSILDRLEQEARLREGTAAQQHWTAEDGWIIGYTTSRMKGGPHDGKFVTQALKPVGKGARTGKASEFHEVYRRQFSTRKAARARALALFKQHSPQWAAKHPGVK